MQAFRGVLAICGGGNAGHAIAVAASRQIRGEIRWLTGSEEKAALLRGGVFSDAGLQSTGVVEARADRVRVISADPLDVIPDADIVIMAVPAFAHAGVLRRIAPHLRPGALVGAFPGRGGFEFEAAQILHAAAPCVFALQTLPWSTRVQQPGKVINIGAVKSGVLMAARPAQRAPAIAALLTHLLGTEFIPTNTLLNVTLGNPGQIIHPGLMYGLFGHWSGRRYTADRIPYFYRDTTDETGAFIEQLSADVRAVAAKIENACEGNVNLSGVLSIHEWLRLSYDSVTADTGTVASCFRTGPLQARKAPMKELAPGQFVPDFAYRYLSEDVPYGLVVTKAIAQIAGIGTPAIDTVVRWAQRKLQARYLGGGSIDAEGTRHLPIPQNCGITTLDELIAWYAPIRATMGTIAGTRGVAS